MAEDIKPLGRCPYCFGAMEVRRVHCEACDVTVDGRFSVPRLFRLKPEQLEFVERFVAVSGSLKEMAAELGVSYPTVRNQLDQIIEVIKSDVSEEKRRRGEVLDALDAGRISVEEASRILGRVK